MRFRVFYSKVKVVNTYRGVHQNNLTRGQWSGFREVRNLIADKNIRISVSDKGGDFVVMPQSLDREISQLHPSDTSIYARVTKKEYQTQCRRLNKVWISVGRTR